MPLFLLIDGNSLMHRAYWAMPHLTNASGESTGALFGFMNMLLKLIRERKPSYAAVAFDMHGSTFRHEQFEEYKAGRRETPDDLRAQFPMIRELLGAMGIACPMKQGFEADDIIGTLSRRADEQGLDALIVTGDRDALQLIGGGVKVLFTKKGITETEELDADALKTYYAITPEQVIDLKGLMGDSSDNIPGIAGVGEKTALKLLAEYGTLDNVLAAADGVKGKLGERLREGGDIARLSRRLATIDRDVPVEGDMDAYLLRALNTPEAVDMLKRLELSKVLAALSAMYPAPEGEAVPPPAREDNWGAWEEIGDAAALKGFVSGIGGLAAITITPRVTIAVEGGARARVNIKESLIDDGIEAEEAFAILGGWLDGPQPKAMHESKALRTRLAAYGISCQNVVYDTAIAAYLLEPLSPNYMLSRLCGEALGEELDDASALLSLKVYQEKKLDDTGMRALMDDIELPLSDVLFKMEREGFRLDTGALHAMGEDFAVRINALVEDIYALAGMEFNLNSTKQLAQVLFERLGLPAGKKTKTGYSTDADVLGELIELHPIAGKLLEYRALVKLRSTYIDGLLTLCDASGRVRTTFHQTVTSTGRISSSEPNLQNIPVRTAMGREIRRAFIASAHDRLLIDADYSQIELRVLAHMSGDENMRDAFIKGQDIHRRTAAEIFGVPLEDVTGEMRSSAKAVNFGVVYGISDFGLANNTGITRAEARDFIDTYFKRYPGVRAFMDACVDKAKRTGYIETMCGRRRPVPELNAQGFKSRSFGERVAMNTPIQGTAADIIKIAMVRVSRALKEGGWGARLILQVHDELIIDAPKEEVEPVSALLKGIMESALPLSVPLTVDLNVGATWYDTK